MWGRGASAGSYGASSTLRDYGDVGAINANTDVTAAQYKRLASDAAASTRTAPIATMLVRYAAGVAYVANCVVPWAPALFLEYLGSAPPSSAYPVAAISGSYLTVNFPVSAVDEYGVSENIIVRIAVSTLNGTAWQGPTGGSSLAIYYGPGFSDYGYMPIVVY